MKNGTRTRCSFKQCSITTSYQQILAAFIMGFIHTFPMVKTVTTEYLMPARTKLN